MNVSDGANLFLESLVGSRAGPTIKYYRVKFKPLLEVCGQAELDQVTIHDLRKVKAELASREEKYTDHPTRGAVKGKYSAWSIYGTCKAIRKLFAWLQEEGLISSDPAERLEVPPLPVGPRWGLSIVARDLLLALARDNPRDYALLRFLADTGCRVGGIAHLRLSELNIPEGKAIVHEKGKGGGKSRTVFFTEETGAALIAYLKVRPDLLETDFVFLGLKRGGKRAGWGPLTESGIGHMIQRYAEEGGVTNAFPHNWRHGAARGMIRNGMPLPIVSQILGHESIQVTANYYGKFSDEVLHEEHQKYSWFVAAANYVSARGGKNATEAE